MPKKTELERKVAATIKALRRRERRRVKDVERRHRELRFVHRASRQFRVAELRAQGYSVADATAMVAGTFAREHFELDVTIQAERKAELAELKREPECEHPDGATFFPLPPRAAISMNDERSLQYWTDEVNRHTAHEAFVEWLATSRLPLLRRPEGIPEFDELRLLEPLWERINEILECDNRKLQRRLQDAVFPVKRGRPRAQDDPAVRALAKEWQARLTRLFTRLGNRRDKAARSEMDAALMELLPGRPEDARQAIEADARGRRPSAAAAYVVGQALRIAPSRVRQGRAQKHKSPRRDRGARTVVAVADLVAVEHARERASRGKRHAAQRGD